MKGFTLIEMLVSVAIFTVVMVIALGALLTMTDSARRAEALKAVINNLNYAMDSMTRSIRTGTELHCGTPSGGDCQNGSNYITFTASNGQHVAYCLSGGAIRRQITAGTPDTVCSSSNFSAVTAPEVSITDNSAATPASYAFYVVGTTPSDTVQPKVSIILNAIVQGSGNTQTKFVVQTTATQRVFDQ